MREVQYTSKIYWAGHIKTKFGSSDSYIEEQNETKAHHKQFLQHKLIKIKHAERNISSSRTIYMLHS